MKIGAKVNIFNYKMRERRKELGISQAQLADYINVSVQYIQRLESLQMPTRNISAVRNMLDNITDALDIDFHLIFPDDYLIALEKNLLPSNKKPMLILRDVEIDTLPPSKDYLCLPSPEDIVMDNPPKMKEDIKKILNELSPQQQQMIRQKFGFDDNAPKTLDELAAMFGTSRERVRQTIAVALRKLNYVGSGRLIEYLYR